jgi:4-aminobutyrate aminotransferase
LQGNALTRGTQLMDHLTPLAGKLPIVGEVRGKGLMVAIELVHPDGRDPNPIAATAALEGSRERGLLIGKGGVHANVLRIAPPLSVTSAEIDEAAAALIDALSEVDAGGR